MDWVILTLVILIVISIGFSFQSVARELTDDLDRYRHAIDCNDILMLEVDHNGLIIQANLPAKAFLGFKNSEPKIPLSDMTIPESHVNLGRLYAQLNIQDTAEAILAMRRPSDGSFQILWHVSPLKNRRGAVKTYLFIGKDMTKQTQEKEQMHTVMRELVHTQMNLADIEQKLGYNESQLEETRQLFAEEEERRSFVLEALNIGVWEYDLENQSFYTSQKCYEILGFPSDVDIQDEITYLCDNIHEDDYLDVVESAYELVLHPKEHFLHNFRIRDAKGEYHHIEVFGRNQFHPETGKLLRLAGSCRNITVEKSYDQKIESYAYYDALTGLYNQTYIQQTVDAYLSGHHQTRSALIYLDIDDFRYINDTFGHAFGDKIIVETAQRILDVAGSCHIARFGGDEICLFIEDVRAIEQRLVDFVMKIVDIMNINYDDDKISYKISISIGVSLFPDHGSSFGELMKCADIALNEAKKAGKNRFMFFNERMNLRLQERIGLEKDLKSALESGQELTLHLQPQYDILSGTLRGFEALSRWHNPARGLVPPSQFIPLAEETRLIIPLGKWVLAEACRMIKNLSEQGYFDLKISVNLSPVQLMDDSLVPAIQEILRQTLINPARLELEITETILMENFDANVKKLNALKKMGISITLDDFGTGYSSLTYLKLLPISIMKIDKSFVDFITESQVDLRIMEVIINLAHIMELETVAEGVETEKQLELLSQSGCDMIQGYFSGQPMPFEEVRNILGKKMDKLDR